MDSEKLESSDTSSEEYDHQNSRHEYSSERKRSFDCTFCKRGFTNAQALGGHMNIHRKDRAKAKQIPANYDSYLFPGEFSNPDSMASPFLSEASAGKYHSVFEAQRNQNVYFQPSEANPTNHFQYEFLSPSSQPLNMNQELWNANLSARTSTSHIQDNEFRRGFQNDDEVDLELRLGHDPYSLYIGRRV